MATNNAAVIVPGEGHFYIAAIGAAKPTGSGVPSAPWVEIGHTSYDEPLTVEREGGDISVLRSWQATALRSAVEPMSYRLIFGLLQHDELSLNLYYGGGQIDAATDEFEVPKVPAAQARALFVRIVDGANVWARYFPATEILGSDSEESDPEALLSMPVTATVIADAGVDYLFSIAGPTTIE